MKPDIKTPTVSPQICEPQNEYGKLKVEQFAENPIPCDRTQPLNSASPVLAEASRGHDGHKPHPRHSDEEKRMPEAQAKMENASMKDTFDNAPDLGRLLGLAVDDGSKRSVKIDLAKYQKYLDGASLSDDQKDEVVRAVWSIITAFVDLGFEIHPMQEVCGKDAEGVDAQANQDSNGINPNSEDMSASFNVASRDT